VDNYDFSSIGVTGEIFV